MLFVLSEASLGSEWVWGELQFARDHGIELVIARIGDVDVANAEGWRIFFKTWQIPISQTDPEGDISALAEELREHSKNASPFLWLLRGSLKHLLEKLLYICKDTCQIGRSNLPTIEHRYLVSRS